MTENEAIEILQEAKRQSEVILNNPTTFYSGKDIMGGCKTMERHIEAYKLAIECISEIQQYRALGTIEELREATEKQMAKKPILQRTYEKTLYKCPCCKNIFVEAYADLQKGYIPKYCEMCGQSIDF